MTKQKCSIAEIGHYYRGEPRPFAEEKGYFIRTPTEEKFFPVKKTLDSEIADWKKKNGMDTHNPLITPERISSFYEDLVNSGQISQCIPENLLEAMKKYGSIHKHDDEGSNKFGIRTEDCNFITYPCNSLGGLSYDEFRILALTLKDYKIRKAQEKNKNGNR